MASPRIAVPLLAGVAAMAFVADAFYGPSANKKTKGAASAPSPMLLSPQGSFSAAAASQVVAPSATHSAAGQLSPAQAAIATATTLVGLPSTANLRFLEGYAASLNYERRIPNWVMEHIHLPGGAATSPPSSTAAGSVTGGGGVSRTESKFYADTTVPELFRATSSDYNDKHGISRGHLAPAQFHKASQADMNETFNLSANIVPQDMTMNACDWYRLETMTKKLAKLYPTSGLYVVTGPMFVPMASAVDPGKRVVSYEVIGEHNVAVPTHLFKAFYGVSETDGKKEVAAFVLPNGPIPEESSLVSFQVPLSYVERVTGLQLFAGPSGIDPSTTAAHQVVDMCRRKKCDGSYGSFSKGNRSIGRIRAATSEKQAQQAFQDAVKAEDANGSTAALERELKHKLSELAARKLTATQSTTR